MVKKLKRSWLESDLVVLAFVKLCHLSASLFGRPRLQSPPPPSSSVYLLCHLSAGRAVYLTDLTLGPCSHADQGQEQVQVRLLSIDFSPPPPGSCRAMHPAPALIDKVSLCAPLTRASPLISSSQSWLPLQQTIYVIYTHDARSVLGHVDIEIFNQCARTM